MNPVDRLCELLDERGVEYKRKFFSDLVNVELVTWRGVGGLEFNALRSRSKPDMIFVDSAIMPPEDVVKVTLDETDTCVMSKDHTTFLEDANTYVTAWNCDRCLGTTYADAELRPRYCSSCGSKVIW